MIKGISPWDKIDFSIQLLHHSPIGTRGNYTHISFPRYILWFLEQGEISILPGEGPEIRIVPGQWVLMPPGYLRSQRFSRKATILSIHFTCEWPNSIPLFSFENPLIGSEEEWVDLKSPLTSLVPLLNKTGMSGRDSFLLMEKSYGFMGTWIDVMEKILGPLEEPPRLDNRLEKALSLLDRMNYRGSLPYSLITEECGVSRVHLDRLCKEQLNRSPKEYLAESILKRACLSLSERRYHVDEIAYDLGFKQPSHFNRWFKERTGQTPLGFRRQSG